MPLKIWQSSLTYFLFSSFPLPSLPSLLLPLFSLPLLLFILCYFYLFSLALHLFSSLPSLLFPISLFLLLPYFLFLFFYSAILPILSCSSTLLLLPLLCSLRNFSTSTSSLLFSYLPFPVLLLFSLISLLFFISIFFLHVFSC